MNHLYNSAKEETEVRYGFWEKKGEGVGSIGIIEGVGRGYDVHVILMYKILK